MLLAACVPLLLALAAVAVWRALPGPARPVGCAVTADGRTYRMDLAQAANAATIAGVARERGLNDHAVTVALATAMQESKLHNLAYGDRDSLGLFQQRPSQGWGSQEQLLDPRYAAGAFYHHLAQVPGWQALPVAVAAQAVQRSADGTAYADWEPAARALARALTGELPQALTCRYDTPASSAAGLTTALGRDLGPAAVGSPVSQQTGWRAATWLVAQSAQYSIVSVSFDGRRWTRSSGVWTPDRSAAGPVVRYRLG